MAPASTTSRTVLSSTSIEFSRARIGMGCSGRPDPQRCVETREFRPCWSARELATRGHYPPMIEAVLTATGFAEAAEWIDQPHVFRELKDIADRARKKAVGLSTNRSIQAALRWGTGGTPGRLSD